MAARLDWRKLGTIVVNRVTASPAANGSLGNAELPNPLRRADLMAMPISVPTYTVDDLDPTRARYPGLSCAEGQPPVGSRRSPRGLGQTFVIDIEPLFRGLE